MIKEHNLEHILVQKLEHNLEHILEQKLENS